VSIRKIHFYNILKVFLILFYSNTSISILILFQKYILQDWYIDILIFKNDNNHRWDFKKKLINF